jgi:hypothetical protein
MTQGGSNLYDEAPNRSTVGSTRGFWRGRLEENLQRTMNRDATRNDTKEGRPIAQQAAGIAC